MAESGSSGGRARDPMQDFFRDVFLVGHPEATRLYLVRHGQAGNNVGSMVLDDEDETVGPPLTELGFEQARRLGRRLAAEGVDAVYSSTLLRARQTAEPLAERLGLAVQLREGIEEVGLDRSAWDGSDVKLRARILAALRERPSWDAFPGAEPSEKMRARVMKAMDQVIAENPGRRVAVFCHGGVIQSYIAAILGIQDDVFFYPFNAGISSVRALGERRTLWRLNDIAHLDQRSVVS
ncbi:MAG: hypothetical protein GEU28_06045 [Dehalococcoidia bacterium]|nr:hypothetical protein [Dehalococcoidia bacterium]